MSSAAGRIKQLRSDALALAQEGKPAQALKKFAQLESLEPAEADWPRRAAECHRLLGARAEQLDALARAASAYVCAGMVVKAMAICNMMLAIDPQHPAALDWMGKLQRPLGIPGGERRRRRLEVAHKPVASTQQPEAGPAAQRAASASTHARRLVAERGLVAVARAVARQTARSPATPPVEPAPSLPARSQPSSGNWQVVDDAELVVDAPEAPAAVQAPAAHPAAELPAAPVMIEAVVVTGAAPPTPRSSLPPLSVNTQLRKSVPGSLPLLDRTGNPSGMFRLVIDDPLQQRRERTLRQAREVLPAVPLFSELDPKSLSGLVRQSRLIHLRAGDVVVEQNDLPDCLYVVVNGSVAVQDQTACSVELYRLGENEFFGESGLISNEPHPTTIVASEDCDLMAFDRETMRSCVADNPSVIPVLLRFLRGRMVEHLLRTSPLFTHFDTVERRGLSRRFEFIEMAEGAKLILQGTRSPGLFVLLSGAVDVTRRDDQREHWLASLERGGVFGEISLLKQPVALADVTCVAAGFALMLPASTFREVIMTHPPFLEVLTRLSDEREQANSRRVVGAK